MTEQLLAQAEALTAVLLAVAGDDNGHIEVTWPRDQQPPGTLRHPAARASAVAGLVRDTVNAGTPAQLTGVPLGGADEPRAWIVRAAGEAGFWSPMPLTPHVVLSEPGRDLAIWSLRGSVSLHAAAAANRWVALCLHGDIRDIDPASGIRLPGPLGCRVLHRQPRVTVAEIERALAERLGLAKGTRR